MKKTNKKPLGIVITLCLAIPSPVLFADTIAKKNQIVQMLESETKKDSAATPKVEAKKETKKNKISATAKIKKPDPQAVSKKEVAKLPDSGEGEATASFEGFVTTTLTVGAAVAALYYAQQQLETDEDDSSYSSSGCNSTSSTNSCNYGRGYCLPHGSSSDNDAYHPSSGNYYSDTQLESYCAATWSNGCGSSAHSYYRSVISGLGASYSSCPYLSDSAQAGQYVSSSNAF
ncbi:MAG: hypothetical protein HQL71_11930 [Magnetococcales bacterium]|nr:hypothetical protein [Magnetococcales bacterium]